MSASGAAVDDFRMHDTAAFDEGGTYTANAVFTSLRQVQTMAAAVASLTSLEQLICSLSSHRSTVCTKRY